MASSTLTLYKDNTTTQAFSLLSTAENWAKWIVSGRPLATPHFALQSVKVNKGSSNDESKFLVSITAQNATTGKLATFLCEIRCSIPKDQSVLTPAIQNEIVSEAVSAFVGTGGATGATTNRTTVLEGRIL